jgi:hypothetical protein
MNEQEMKALHRKIDGVTAIAQAIERHHKLVQLQF